MAPCLRVSAILPTAAARVEGVPNLLHDPAARSGLMRSIRSTRTTPEVLVFAEMRRRRIWFQPNYRRAPGSPDLARPRDRRAVFIDGDFWHGRELPRVEARYGQDSQWARKLRRNVDRDRENDRALIAAGWTVLHVWESDIRRASTRGEAFDHIASFLVEVRDRVSSRGVKPSSPAVRTFVPAGRGVPKSRG